MALQNTRKSAFEIARALEGKGRLFFIGIGGVHMASLAIFSQKRGFFVGGSDRAESEATARLCRAGIEVRIGHDEAAIEGYDAVIYTLAIDPENPEYRAAVERGLPLFSRADYLGYLMSLYPRRIGVAGSHGKSTVTAMLAEIFVEAGRDPVVFCGAPMRRFGGGLLAGEGGDFLFEACEYEDSFLSFSPTLAVILNLRHDHVDYFPDMQSFKKSFAAFGALPGEQGTVLYPAGDADCLEALSATPARRATFGLCGGDFTVRQLRLERGRAVFTLVLCGVAAGEVRLRVPGEHNLLNALAAAGAAYLSGVEPRAIVRGLCEFGGAGRRMEYRGRLCGAPIYDDYAHHPDEILATLTAARQMNGKGRLFAVFQSHTYSRTAAFLPEIGAALRLADRVLVAPIYPARETDTLGMSGERIAASVGERASAHGSIAEIARCLSQEVAPHDTVVVMGAGDIDRIFGEFSAKDFTL